MNQEAYIFEVTEKTFPSAVLQNSEQLPVFVLFQGVWSEPCFVEAELLSQLANEFAGRFVFAKVDIDEQAELRKQYRIENVPTLIIFQDGEESRREEGQMQEAEARAVLGTYGIKHESDDLREEARKKHLSGDTAGAIVLLTQAIQKHPSNTRVAMDMVQIFIDIGDINSAQGLYGKLPQRDKESDMGKALNGQLSFLELASKTEGLDVLQQRIISEPKNHEARFDLSVCQVAAHQYKSAMDNLFEIQQSDPAFRNGAAREMIITLIRMLTPSDPRLAQEYQRRLSNLLAN
ncbi:MAG: tetratricopeptide repeat protein [Gammaproteobacteria bacterium]|nr:tetratricopeptide repeat protein [Gammaproteobacteria bacterium]